MIKPAQYWREQRTIKEWLGKVGQVIGNTTIRTTSPELSQYVPFDYAIVDFNGQKKEFMAISGEQLKPGDLVKLVLRKLSQPDRSSLIEYGLKLEKVKEEL